MDILIDNCTIINNKAITDPPNDDLSYGGKYQININKKISNNK